MLLHHAFGRSALYSGSEFCRNQDPSRDPLSELATFLHYPQRCPAESDQPARRAAVRSCFPRFGAVDQRV